MKTSWGIDNKNQMGLNKSSKLSPHATKSISLHLTITKNKNKRINTDNTKIQPLQNVNKMKLILN